METKILAVPDTHGVYDTLKRMTRHNLDAVLDQNITEQIYLIDKGENMYKKDYTLEDYHKVTDECSARIKNLLQKRYEELKKEQDAVNDRYPYEDLYLKWEEVDDEEFLIRFLLRSLEAGTAELKAKRKKEYEEAILMLTHKK